jgi:hypothetical protein
MAAADKLREMINVAPDQVENLDGSIDQINNLIEDFNEEIDAITNALCTPAKNELTDYLNNTKLSEIEGLYGDPFNTPFTVDYGPNYGTIAYSTGGIDDFKIADSSGNTMYSYEGVNWDGDTTITKLVEDYAFGNDYLTRPLTTGASYGIIPNRDNLSTAKALLTANKTKIDESIDVFEDYAS